MRIIAFVALFTLIYDVLEASHVAIVTRLEAGSATTVQLLYRSLSIFDDIKQTNFHVCLKNGEIDSKTIDAMLRFNAILHYLDLSDPMVSESWIDLKCMIVRLVVSYVLNALIKVFYTGGC